MLAYYSGFSGIEIQEIEYGIEDKVIFTAGAWTGNKSNHECKIYYETERPYFKFKGQRIHLDECIRR